MNLRLRELRESRGFTVATMIERLGVKDSRYRKWESESAAIPLEYALMCCQILKCSMDELAGREAPVMSADELRLVELYRAADTRGKTSIMRVADGESTLSHP